MTIRIKNWDDFQHYKGRTPPWIKLYRKLLDDPEWFALSGDASKMLANCWLLASEHDGNLPDLPTIAFRLRMSEKRAQELISQLSHWLEDDASGLLARCKQDACLETDTERDTDKKDIRSVAVATRPVQNEKFAEFWKSYPRRQGSNPKHPARKKFEAFVRSGISPDSIIAAARAYAEDEKKLQHIGTPYVAQAVTWLNQQRFEDYQRHANSAAPPPGLSPEQRAAWVREQMRSERENADQQQSGGGRLVLEGGGPIRSPEFGRH